MFEATDQVSSEIFSLGQFLEMHSDQNFRFTVPLYQRLYVWGPEQISRLLSDIESARVENRTFYLGGVLMVKKDGQENSLDLIDGQQRFTTLWLLSCYLRKKLADSSETREALDHFIGYKPQGKEEPKWRPRLHFIAREEQNEALERIALEDPQPKTLDRYTEPLHAASDLFDKYLPKEALAAFAHFLITQTKLIATIVPSSLDLNKLFEVINNRGVQLQHHEILKAQMLHRISDEESRSRYAQMWEACADMAGFVDQNLTQATPLSAKDLAKYFNEKQPAQSPIAKGEVILERLQEPANKDTNDNTEAQTLSEILKASDSESGHSNNIIPTDHDEYNDDEDRSWAKAPISFSMLLQHTLRIWLHLHSPDTQHDSIGQGSSGGSGDLRKVDDKWLIQCFEEHFFRMYIDETSVTSFLHLLWEVRFILDYYGIKWVEEDDEEYLRVVKATRTRQTQNSGDSINRDRQHDAGKGLSLLQAMLYHSQELVTQYWLTPYLAFIHQEQCSLEGAYAYLRHLDNVLLGRPGKLHQDGTKPLIRRTRQFLGRDNCWRERVTEEDPEWDFEQELSPQGGAEEGPGLHCRHYWFYKLDFILWFLDNEGDHLIDSTPRPGLLAKSQEKDFRMTSRTSVEHVTPQNPDKTDSGSHAIHEKNLIDCFGNLALVSRSINSQYSSHSFSTKRAKFKETQQRQKHCVSPKLIDIFYQEYTWAPEKLLAHQDRMLSFMRRYYALDFRVHYDAIRSNEAVNPD